MGGRFGEIRFFRECIVAYKYGVLQDSNTGLVQVQCGQGSGPVVGDH